MRIFNRSHLPWLFFTIAATAASAWIYLGNFAPQSLPPGWALPPRLMQTPAFHRHAGGTPIGLIFGSVAFAIFIFGGLLSVRKRIVLWRIGSVQSWMRAHIWLTFLTIPLVFLHCGFRFGAPMTVLLMMLYGVVMISGIYGLILQHYLPALMKERLPNEIVYEQIPHIRRQLYRAAEQMRDSLEKNATRRVALTPSSVAEEKSVAPLEDPKSEEMLVQFLDEQVLPYLAAEPARRLRLAGERAANDAFRFVDLSVAEIYRSRVEKMQSWCDERRQLDLQVRLQHWLHAWLFVHVPLSFLLILLTAWHALVSLFYY